MGCDEVRLSVQAYPGGRLQTKDNREVAGTNPTAWKTGTTGRGVTNLIRVRRGDEEDRTRLGNLPGASRVNFTEEEVDEDTKNPEEEVVLPVHHGIELLWRGRVRHALRRRSGGRSSVVGHICDGACIRMGSVQRGEPIYEKEKGKKKKLSCAPVVRSKVARLP